MPFICFTKFPYKEEGYMKSVKIFGIMLGVAVMVFVIAPVASAQTIPGILHDTWFKLNVNMKGYSLAGDTVEGKGGGSTKAYLHMAFDSINNVYTIQTCTEPDMMPNPWVLGPPAIISTDNIYGAIYPEIWDVAPTPIVFDNGPSTFDAYATLFTKITANGATLNKASISTISCALYAFENPSPTITGIGSCKITGSNIKPDKVTSTVPLECRQ
jgi:hypothetical protein